METEVVMRYIMLSLHFIGLGMGIGNGFAHMFLGMAAKKMEPAEARDFQIKTMAVNKMGYIGLFLLVLSGGYMMTPFWSSLSDRPELIAKFVAVLVLVLMIVVMNGIAKKAAKSDGDKELSKLEKMGKVTLPLGIIIIVLAVLTFK